MGNTMGKEEISDAEVIEAVKNGAKSRVEEEMKSCAEEAESKTGQAKRDAYKACRDTNAKKVLAESLGKKETEISTTDIIKTVKSAGRSAAVSAMKAARSNTQLTNKEKIERAKKAIKSATAREDLRDDEVTSILKEGAKENIASTMATCSAVAYRIEDKKARSKALYNCKRESAKKAYKESLGKDDAEIEEAEVEEMVQDAARDAISKAMTAEKEAGTDRTTRMSNLVNVLKQQLGKEDVKKKDVVKTIRDGAKDAATKTMSACYSDAKEKAESYKGGDKKKFFKDTVAACKTADVKKALASSLGKDTEEVSKVEVEKFVRNGAKDVISKAMEAVIDTDTTMTKKAIRDIGRKALASALGVNVSDVKPRKFEMFKRKGAKRKAMSRMRACVKAARERLADNTTAVRRKAIRKCRGKSIQLAIKKSMGNATVSRAKTKALLKDGARNAVTEAREACILAAEGNATELQSCKENRDDLKSVLADSLGKDAEDIDDADVEEFVLDGAEDKATETVVSCHEVGMNETECQKNVESEVALALGKEVPTKAARRRLQEVDADDTYVTEREVEGFKLRGIDKYVKEKLEAAKDAADEKEEDLDEVVKEALIEAGNKKKEKVSKEEIIRAKKDAAVNAIAETNEAIAEEEEDFEEADISGDEEKETGLTEDEKESERVASVNVTGFDLKKKPLLKQMFKKKAGMKRMAQALLACKKSKRSRTICKIRLAKAFRKATASDLLADDKEEGIRKVRLAIQAAKALIKRNIQAAKELNKKARKKTEGRARFLRRLLADDKLKPDDFTKAAGEIVRPAKYADADNEEQKQEIAGDELEDCLDQNDATVNDCRSKVETNSKDLRSEEPDKKKLIQEIVARKELDAVDDEDDCTDAKKETCKKETKERLKKYSGKEGRKRVKRAWNARRQAAKKWNACEDAGNTEVECCEKAKAEFKKRGGVGRWSKCTAKRMLADGKKTMKDDIKSKNKKEMSKRVDKVRRAISGKKSKTTTATPERIKLKRRQAVEVSVAIKKKCTDKDAIAEIAKLKTKITEEVTKHIKPKNDVTVTVVQDMEDDEDGQSQTCNCGWTAKFKPKSKSKAKTETDLTDDEIDAIAESIVKETQKENKGRRLFLLVTEVSAAGSIDMNDSDEDFEEAHSPDTTFSNPALAGGLGTAEIIGIVVGGLAVMALMIYGAIKLTGKNKDGLAAADTMSNGNVEMQVNPSPNEFLKNMKA